jgi:hypothetical protein
VAVAPSNDQLAALSPDPELDPEPDPDELDELDELDVDDPELDDDPEESLDVPDDGEVLAGVLLDEPEDVELPPRLSVL